MSNLELIFPNVGQGNCVILKLPNGKAGIIDCNSYCDFLFYEDALSQLKSINSSELEFACLTHQHIDHLRGFGEILDYYTSFNRRIVNLWINDLILIKDQLNTNTELGTELTQIYNKTLGLKNEDEIGFKGKIVNYSEFNANGLNYDLGDNISIHYTSPLKKLWYNYRNKVSGDFKKIGNVYCGCIKIVIGDFSSKFSSVLLPADSMKSTIQRACNRSLNDNKNKLRFDLIHVVHHGSGFNNSKNLWNGIAHKDYNKKSIAIIQSGNNKKLPPEKTLIEILGSKSSLYCCNMSKHCPSKKNYLIVKKENYKKKDDNIIQIGKEKQQRASLALNNSPVKYKIPVNKQACSGTIAVTLNEYGIKSINRQYCPICNFYSSCFDIDDEYITLNYNGEVSRRRHRRYLIPNYIPIKAYIGNQKITLKDFSTKGLAFTCKKLLNGKILRKNVKVIINDKQFIFLGIIKTTQKKLYRCVFDCNKNDLIKILEVKDFITKAIYDFFENSKNSLIS